MTVDSIRPALITIKNIDGDDCITAATSFDTEHERPLMRFSVKGETEINGKPVMAQIPIAISFADAKALGAWLTENVRPPKPQRQRSRVPAADHTHS